MLTKTNVNVLLCHWYFSYLTVNSDLLYPVDLPPPPEHQKPPTADTTAKRKINPKQENLIMKALIASQQVQIKRLRNVIVDLQNEVENVKKENRTLKQVSPSSLLLSLSFCLYICEATTKFVQSAARQSTLFPYTAVTIQFGLTQYGAVWYGHASFPLHHLYDVGGVFK